jgi:hypothetical protein
MRLMLDIPQIKNIALVSINVIFAIVAFKAVKGLMLISDKAQAVGDAVGETIADAYIAVFLPDVVEAQIRIQSRYFESGILKPEAETVLILNYPDIYALMFRNGRMLPQYQHYIDSGTALTNRGAKEALGDV